MATSSQRPGGRDGTLSALNVAIETMDLAEVSVIAPAKAAFGSVSVILTMIKVRYAQRQTSGRSLPTTRIP